MNLYERLFEGDWDSIGSQEALKRAYVLGVTHSRGEPCEDELEELLTEFEGVRDRGLIELAFDEGIHHDSEERKGADLPDGFSEEGWAESARRMIEEETPDRDGDTETPKALSKTGALDRYSPDSTDAVELPDLLRRT
jgi:hypothetical protein